MRSRLILFLAALVVIGATVAVVTRSNDAGAAPRAAAGDGITEANLPAGFTATPAVVVNGKPYRFAAIPGHYWKVLNKRGYAVGLHFQTDKPFPWAKDVAKGTLLYLIYAIPGTCGDGNYAKAIKAPNATIEGKVLPGFDHWHAFQGGGSKVGTWYTHIPVRSFTLAGPPGNPAEGTRITAGTPKFIPVCDIVK
jgi:hypothetical protein